MSVAQIQFLAVDNTHVKYLKGDDKKAWNNYKEAYESMRKAENFLNSLGAPVDLKAGEVYEIPVRKGQDKNKKK